MTNPYQPPQEASENRMAQLLVPGSYWGGFGAVTAVGIVGGVLVGLVIYSEAWLRYLPDPVPRAGRRLGGCVCGVDVDVARQRNTGFHQNPAASAAGDSGVHSIHPRLHL